MVTAWFSVNCCFVSQSRAHGEEVFGPLPEGRGERRKEDDLGFGQLVPLLLLILPLMTFTSTYHSEGLRCVGQRKDC